MKLSLPLAPALAALVLSQAASGQEFNLDVGDTFTIGSPSNAYGAAAGQAGEWFSLNGGPPYNFTLSDINGNATAVVSNAVNTGTGSGDFYSDNPGTTGDDELLMDDFEDVGGLGSDTVWTFSGLADGDYDVYTYSWASDNAGYRTDVTIGNDTQQVGGAWPGGHQLGVTYAQHCVTISGGADLVINAVTVNGFGSVNGFQIVERSQPCPPDEPGIPFCDCQGGGPCGNAGGPGNGCANGFDPNGANLTGTGIGDTSNDTVVLVGTGLVPTQPGLYFQGDNAINGGSGTFFGDGLRCAGMNVVRLQVVNADANGDSQTSIQISTSGGVAPGDVKHYQLWYRDPNTSPCGSGFNLTNGYTITWI